MPDPPEGTPAETAIGPHRYRLAEDVFEWAPQGEVLAEHVQRVCEILLRQLGRYGYILWKVDARGSVPLGLEARRFYALWIIEHQPRLALAAFGTSTLPATTAVLTQQAVRIKSGREFQMRNFATQEEAGEYLSEQRRQFRSELAAASSPPAGQA
jgi:hypothetical protein